MDYYPRNKQAQENYAYTSALLVQEWLANNLSNLLTLKFQFNRKHTLSTQLINLPEEKLINEFKAEFGEIVTPLHPNYDDISCKVD